MKNIIGVALFFLVAAAPALAGGNGGGTSNSGGGFSNAGGRMSGGTSTFSGGFGSQPAPRSFVPLSREAPVRFAPQPFAQPERKRNPVESTPNDYIASDRQPCPKNPYQQPAAAANACQVNPWVLYAFPSSDF